MERRHDHEHVGPRRHPCDLRCAVQRVRRSLRGSRDACGLRVLVGGEVARPKTPIEVVTQDASNDNDVEGQWMIERSTPVLGPGRYKIVVQHAAAGDPTTYFAINAWHVIAERIAA